MVAALELYLDAEATRRVRGLWKALEDEGIPTLFGLLDQKHRPHVSLAVARTLAPSAVASALDGLPVGRGCGSTGASVTDHANDIAHPL